MSTPFRDWRSMVYTVGTRADGGNVYGDGTVYQSVRSKDSEVVTIDMTAHEYKTLWYSATADVERLQQRMVELEKVAQRALDAIYYWYCEGETPGAHDMLVKTHDALRDVLHPVAEDWE